MMHSSEFAVPLMKPTLRWYGLFARVVVSSTPLGDMQWDP